MRIWPGTLVVGMIGLAVLATQAQQPPAKGPALPPVNPANAKADITVTGLDGPGFAIASGGEVDRIVVSCEHGTIQAFKKDTIAAFKGGKGEPEVWKGHQGPVRGVAWHGGPTLVSVGADKKVNFWKLPEGKLTQSGTVDFRIRALALTADGKTAAVAGEADVIQLWDVAAGKPTAKLTDKMDWVLALAFSADGKQLASGDHAGVIRLWDVAGAKKVGQITPTTVPPPKTPPAPIAVTCLAYAPDGKALVVGMADGPIHLVSPTDGKIIRTFTGHTGPITGIAFHPTGTLMASCSKDRTVKLWNPAGPQPAVQALKSLEGHSAWIEGIVFFDQATKLATVSADQTLRTWDLTDPPKKK